MRSTTSAPRTTSSASRPTCDWCDFACSSRSSPCSRSRSPSRPRSSTGSAGGSGPRSSCRRSILLALAAALGTRHRLARPSRARTRRTARGGASDPRGRLRPRPIRVAARLADRPRQPPRVPGGGRAPVGDGDPAARCRSRSRSSTSTTSSSSTTRAVTPSATGSSARPPTTIATYLRRSDRAFRIGGDEFAIIMPGHRRRPRSRRRPPPAGRLPRRRR